MRDWALGLRIGHWDRGFGFGIGVRDWALGLGIGDWESGSRIDFGH